MENDNQGFRTHMEQPKLLDQVRNKNRLKHFSIRTEQAYVLWSVRGMRTDVRRCHVGLSQPEG